MSDDLQKGKFTIKHTCDYNESNLPVESSDVYSAARKLNRGTETVFFVIIGLLVAAMFLLVLAR